MLVKSCKMVPVMLMGTLLHNKHYSPVEYICMSLIGRYRCVSAGAPLWHVHTLSPSLACAHVPSMPGCKKLLMDSFVGEQNISAGT